MNSKYITLDMNTEINTNNPCELINQNNKFDMSKIKKNSCILIIGKRSTGKSFLVRDIINNKKNVNFDLIISPFEKHIDFYSKIVPGKIIHKTLTLHLLEKFLNKQRNHYKIKNIKNTGLIFNNCFYDRKLYTCNNIREIFLNKRSLGIMIISTFQHVFNIPHVHILTTNYIFIFRQNIIRNKKKLYEHYGSMFSTFNEFCSILDKYTNDYNCLVIDNTSKSNNIKECIYWYKSKYTY